MTTVLPASFYARPTLVVLDDLIGKVLAHTVNGRRTAGIIVEAEAYIGEDDPACHAAPGRTARNAPLYGPPGRAYVYLNYGIHYLVNAVTEAESRPAAVLIRALAPLEGLELMRERRRVGRHGARRLGGPPNDAELCSGPGNVTVALGIDRSANTADLTAGPLVIEDHGLVVPRLTRSARVGIRVGVERPWRCSWAGHPSVSATVTARGVSESDARPATRD
jgi:DNA-3-methyladenine glycosylase